MTSTFKSHYIFSVLLKKNNVYTEFLFSRMHDEKNKHIPIIKSTNSDYFS